MASYPAQRDPKRRPTHPGEILREDVFPALSESTSEIARHLGLSRQHLHAILAEKKPVSAVTAVKLGKLLGNGAGLWLRLQARYDAWQAERDIDTSGIPTLKVG